MNNPDHTPLRWQYIENELQRTFIFRNFVECVRFITDITPLAEKLQHHPDISVFSYKHVKITLSTHDAGKTVTQKDILLAEMINELFDIYNYKSGR